MGTTIREKKELEFTDEMMVQQDLIDNAVYEVCCRFLDIPDEEREGKFPWDIRILSEIRESIMYTLRKFGKPVCYPYIEHIGEKEFYCKTEDCGCGKCIRETCGMMGRPAHSVEGQVV